MGKDAVRLEQLDRTCQLLERLGPVIDDLARVPGLTERAGQPYAWVAVVARSAIVRQAEVLRSAVHSVEHEEGFAVASLVRPAVEELISIEYLATLPAADAGEYLAVSMGLDVTAGLLAQMQYEGGTRIWGRPVDPGYQAAAETQRTTDLMPRMVALGRQHGWPIRGKNAKAQCFGPSMGFMASAAGRRDLYDYLYAAASRLVHFSPYELARRGWYNPEVGDVTFSSQSLNRWWSSFALGWGGTLLWETLSASVTLVPAQEPLLFPDDLPQLLVDIQRATPELITRGELNLSPNQREAGAQAAARRQTPAP